MKTDPALERRLREWAARQEPEAAQMEALADRILRQASKAAPDPVRPAAGRGWRLAYALGGAAAMALLCLGWEWFRTAPVVPPPLVVDDQGRPMKALFQEASRLFPQQLRWLAQSNGEVGLGVESVNPKAIPQTRPVLVRLTVMARLPPETRWRESWTTEVIARTEDLVEIVPSRQADNRLMLWVYGLDNGKLAVETDLRLEKPIKLASRLNGILNEREPMEMASGRQGRLEYKVIQVVEPVNAEGGPS